jgi:hypothetical protein
MPGDGDFAGFDRMHELTVAAPRVLKDPSFLTQPLQHVPVFHETQTGQFSTQWLGEISVNGGRVFRSSGGCSRPERWANRQPAGRFSMDGTLPRMAFSFVFGVESSRGIESNSPLVYA